MRFAVDPWDPGYGTSDELGAAPVADTEQAVDAGVEVAPERWRPVAPTPAPQPSQLLVVDGVRRVDARLTVGDGQGTAPGLAVSWASGVVRCRAGHEAEVLDPVVRRGVFSTSAEVGPLEPTAPAGLRWAPHRVLPGPEGTDPMVLAVGAELAALEAQVAGLARARWSADDDLLLLDGPVRQASEGLERCLGYAKTHHRHYLPPELEAVVGRLAAGERTPAFVVHRRGSLPRASWYLRLPGSAPTALAAWAGVVRLETVVRDGDPGPALALAATSQLLLPALATRAHKDPRAPQQLLPVAGLERLLRQRLGDRRLLLRGIRTAAARAG